MGLNHIVIGTGLEANNYIVGVALSGEHDDRDAGNCPDLVADIDAALSRQHDVQQHKIRRVLLEDLYRRNTIARKDGLIAI